MKNLFKARWMTSLIFLILLFVITGIAAPGFLTYDNIVTCFNTATMYTLLAVGIAFVIMTGEIDVSIGATLGLTAGMTGLIAQQGGSIPKMLLLCLVTGAAIGLVNGVGVSYFGVPSLIFTLGTNSVVRGLIYIMSGGRTIENFGGAISSYGNKTVFAGITLYYAIAVVLVAISHLALTKTRKGKYFIAVGDNAGGANLVGISVLSTKILAYVLCGLFAGLGGFVFASKYGQVMTVAGNGYEMTAIAACVLGGISLSGGLGNVIGAAIGAVIMSSIGRLLVFIGLPSTYNNTITGTMLIVIVVIDALAQLLGGSLHVTGAYPAWEYRRESPLRDKLAAVYTQQTGKEPKIEAIHAGLECGLFAGQLPGLDCVSFGPDLVDIHTTREKMSISSVQRTWQFLLGALAALKD